MRTRLSPSVVIFPSISRSAANLVAEKEFQVITELAARRRFRFPEIFSISTESEGGSVGRRFLWFFSRSAALGCGILLCVWAVGYKLNNELHLISSLGACVGRPPNWKQKLHTPEVRDKSLVYKGCSFTHTGLDFRAALAFVREKRQRRQAGRDLSGMPVAEPSSSQDPVSQDSQDIQDAESGDRAAERAPVVTIWRSSRTAGVVDSTEMHSASVQVDESLMGFIIGKGGSTKEKIEAETGTTLCIPDRKQAKSHNPVVVRGPSQEAVDAAVQQIEQVLEKTIQSPRLQYSHFISIPLASNPTLVEMVKSFRESVLTSANASCDGCRGVDESIFVKPTTFHLTLLMLKLWNEERVCMAQDCLQRVMPDVHKALEGRPLPLKLAGVECMQGNLQKVNVLYARVEADEQASRLLRICKVLTEAFAESGLVLQKDQERSLKLHATLMNTAQRRNRGGRQTFQGRIPFDAREIITAFGSHDWGQHKISEVHLSQRFVYDENGYYHCCGSIPIPSTSPV